MWHKLKQEKQALVETIKILNNKLDVAEAELARTKKDIDRKVLNLFCERGFYVNPHHIFDITPNSGIPYLGQEPIAKEKAKQLKGEADFIKASLLYDVLQETLRQKAVDMGLKTSQNWEQVLASKMMLHNLGLIKDIVDKILKIDPDKLPEASGISHNVL
jgi:hypothetical protein